MWTAQSPFKGRKTQLSSVPSPLKSNRRCFINGEEVGVGGGVIDGVGVREGGKTLGVGVEVGAGVGVGVEEGGVAETLAVGMGVSSGVGVGVIDGVEVGVAEGVGERALGVGVGEGEVSAGRIPGEEPRRIKIKRVLNIVLKVKIVRELFILLITS